PRGTIRIAAARLGADVAIDVSDDGGGIDPKAIRRIAAARGLMAAGALATLSDAQALDLVFLPGFSTAARVTEISGRGVGMDAVRTAVTKLGGQVGLSSTPGSSTRVRLAFPATLALASLVVVRTAGDIFGIPL